MPDNTLINALFGGPSWLEQANQQRQKDLANYLQSGVTGLMADTQGTQGLAGGFGGTTKGINTNKIAKFANDITGIEAPGFFTSDGRVLDIGGYGKHHDIAEQAGVTLTDLFNEGTGRIHIQPESKFLGIETSIKPTSKQIETLSNYAKNGNYERFAVDVADTSRGAMVLKPGHIFDGIVTPKAVRDTVSKAFSSE